jgi:hypothetical protein
VCAPSAAVWWEGRGREARAATTWRRADAVRGGQVKVFAVTVGRQPSLASYCLYTLDEVHELLLGLSVQTKRRLRSAATMLELNSVRTSPARPESWAPAPSPGPVY